MEPAVMMLLEEIRQRVVAQSVLLIAIFLMLTELIAGGKYDYFSVICLLVVLDKDFDSHVIPLVFPQVLTD